VERERTFHLQVIRLRYVEEVIAIADFKRVGFAFFVYEGDFTPACIVSPCDFERLNPNAVGSRTPRQASVAQDGRVEMQVSRRSAAYTCHRVTVVSIPCS
jgi:hypothetical protein